MFIIKENLINILLIEDNLGDARMIMEMINDIEGNIFKIIHTENLNDGIKTHKNLKCQIILLDLFLPDSMGINTILHMLKEASDIPIIILSGIDDQLLAIDAVKYGAQDYLIKGKTDSTLLERSIYYAIERHQNKEEMKKLMKDLKLSEKRLSTLFKNAPIAIILHDINGNIYTSNKMAEKLFSYTQDELISLNVYNFFEEESLNDFRQELKNHIESQPSTKKFEGTIKNKQNSFKDVGISSSFFKVDGKVFIETLFSDISDRISYEKTKILLIDHLIATLETKTTFFSAMSHDLRTPLNAIIGFSELLLEDMNEQLSEEQLDFLRDINESAENLLELIIFILDYSEIEAGIFKINKVKFNIMPIINDLSNILTPKLKRRKLDFQIMGIEKNSSVFGDIIKFKQILYNLIDNAIKFTENGSITFRGIEREDNWEFQVEDIGSGIAKDDYDVVFREFGRIENDIKKKVSGSGLGLALTKRLIELHGGEIWFESEIGKGTTFFFTIPK